MKKIIFLFTLTFFLSGQSFACPYSSMAKIDQKLEFSSNLPKDLMIEILNLRSQGENELNKGNVKKSELIFEKALALFK